MIVVKLSTQANQALFRDERKILPCWWLVLWCQKHYHFWAPFRNGSNCAATFLNLFENCKSDSHKKWPLAVLVCVEKKFIFRLKFFCHTWRPPQILTPRYPDLFAEQKQLLRRQLHWTRAAFLLSRIRAANWELLSREPASHIWGQPVKHDLRSTFEGLPGLHGQCRFGPSGCPQHAVPVNKISGLQSDFFHFLEQRKVS